MDELSEKMPTKVSGKSSTGLLEDAWQPLARLRGDIERMFEDFVSALPSPWAGAEARRHHFDRRRAC